MTLPTVTFEIAFTDPGSTPTWTDVPVPPHLRAAHTRRGTQHEMQRVQAGTAVAVAGNADRRFDPTYASSPYYPNVLPMRRARLRATWATVTYDLFTGYVEAWPQSWPDQVDAVVNMELVDAFRVLAGVKVSGAYPEQLSGARITALLDAAGWPSADRSIAAGLTTVPALTFDQADLLEEAWQAARAEEGRFFVDRSGLVTFRDRDDTLATSSFDWDAVTWGDDPSEHRYQDITLTYDDTDIANEIRVTRTGGEPETVVIEGKEYTADPVGGAEQVVIDDASQTKYLLHSRSETDVHVVTDLDALDMANHALRIYSDPEIRVARMALRPSSDDSWASVLPLEVGDKVRGRRRPPGGGSTIEQRSYVEGINHDITPDHWDVTLQLSPAERTMGFWVLGDAEFGILGSTTRLGR